MKKKQHNSNSKPNICPCDKKGLILYKDCCMPYLSYKKLPSTTLELMKSRYTAYVLNDNDYLLNTWHMSTRPSSLNLQGINIEWLNLEILSHSDGLPDDDEGTVFFIASYKENKVKYSIHEESKFVKEDGKWLYLFGQNSRVAVS